MLHRGISAVISVASLAAHIEVLALEPMIDIYAHLDGLRPEGWGAPMIISQQEGVLSGEAASIVVLYVYQIGVEQDRNGWQYLIAFRGSESTPPVQIGGGAQRFTTMRIEDKIIHLAGKALRPGDPMCCPTKPVQIKYILGNERLMAKAEEY